MISLLITNGPVATFFPQELVDVMCAGTSGLQLKIQDADDAELSNEVKNMIETV